MGIFYKIFPYKLKTKKKQGEIDVLCKQHIVNYARKMYSMYFRYCINRGTNKIQFIHPGLKSMYYVQI